MNYYISDLHLFHKNVTAEGRNFDNRPFDTLKDMHEAIKENWNKTVTNADHVYILGDLAWKENDEAIALVSSLRGNKHLIFGNHDKVKDQRYKRLFVEICDYKEIKDKIDGEEYRVVMSHFPIAFWNHQHRVGKGRVSHKIGAIHLYGHLHCSREEDIFQNFIKSLNEDYGIKCVAKNVGCMLWGYTPRTLKKNYQLSLTEKQETYEGRENMKEDTKLIISIVAVLLLVICFVAGTTYICKHPEKRGISYYEDSDYYICDVEVDARDCQNHFGVIKKSDYEKWKRGDGGTIWLVDAKYKDRGWRLNCRNIISIVIYDKDGWIPLFF